MVSRPLRPFSAWNATLSIPTQLFMDQPGGTYVEQSYHVFPNGTFSASDDRGNSFSFSVPIMAPGVSTSTLIGNSTVAVFETRVDTGQRALADVKLTFSVYDQSCQPAGVRLVISGYEGWGPTESGRVSLTFNKPPVISSRFRAYFGNASGVALGFDWSDSESLAPRFDPSNGTLTYSVGDSFSIDPVTIATTSSAIGPPYQTRMCYAAGRYWVFYFDGTNYGFVSSHDGANWSNETVISTSGKRFQGGIAAACSGSTVYRALVGASGEGWDFDSGTLGANGSVTWGTETQLGAPDTYKLARTSGPAIAVGSDGSVWVAVTDQTTNHLEVWEGPSTWTLSRTLAAGTDCPDLVPLPSGRMSLVYATSCAAGAGTNLGVENYNGSSWSSPATTSGTYKGPDFAATAVNDTTEVCAYSGNGPYALDYLSFPYGGSWSAPRSLASAPAPNGCAIESDHAGRLVVAWAEGNSGQGNTAVYFENSTDGGGTWGPATLLTDDQNINGPVSGIPFEPGAVMVTWPVYSPPEDIRFALFTPTVPQAATSTDPWSRPGLSPYESYFAHFSSYVSPGNGLLTVGQGTLDLPGRGLDLSLSLVYSMPYVFQSGSPVEYDNSSLADVGAGWSLNLPWVGAGYLHLGDGQAIPDGGWKGPKNEYHGVVDFGIKVSSAGDTLTMSDGTTWQFNAAGQPTSETDTSGNAITFAYSSGRLVRITDTVGRNVTLSYGPEGRLSNMSSGGHTWTLGHSGDDLVSVTDPLGRVTAYAYGTGINGWLLSSVGFPTGGSLEYSYGNAIVWGNDTRTYYVTSVDTYYAPGMLSQSQSISYQILDGKVTWSNTTVSDGFNPQEHVDTNFRSTSGLTKAYYEDGTAALQQVVETESDANGRTVGTELISPSGAVLAYTNASYDQWGNTVYSRDEVGQQAWSVYGGDTISFPSSSGCSDTGFYSQTWPTNVHDLLAGSCTFQNGAGSAQTESFYQYDSTTGNLLKQKVTSGGTTSYSYDRYGNVVSATNPDGVTTHFLYSPAYDHTYLTKTWTLDGTQNVTTTYTYDMATGNKLSETNPDGQTTSYQYDALGRTTQITYPAVGGVNPATSYSYDDANNILTTTGPDGHVTKAYFDGLARETEVQQMNGTAVYSTAYYTYNWLDKVATKTTATGHTYTYAYDWDGRLTKLTNPDGTYETTSYSIAANTKTVADENGHPTVYHYDRNQELTSVKEYNSSTTYYLTTYSYDLSGNMLSSTDAKGQTTSYQYDDLNRLVKTTFPDGTYETKTYDAVGNLLTRTTANGSTISYAYDALNRLVQVIYPGSGGSVTYTYDANGNRLSQVSPSATDYYSYDAMGRLTNQTEYVGGAKYSTLYAYDNASNIVQITYPDGYTLSMTYDALNRLKTVGALATLNYTADSQVSTIRYGDGETQSYAYDSRDRPVQIRVAYGSTVEMLLGYTYDGTGNALTENSQTYSYDWLNRLTNSSGPWGTVSYAYDSVGNRVQTVNGSTTTDYAYGPFNRLLSAGNVNYTYDANGNMITKSGGWTYNYDYENRLTGVSHNGLTIQTNSYDGDGNRIMQTAGTNSIVYSYQGVNILYQKNLTSDITTKSFYAGGIQVAQMVGTVLYYLHQDALGSTRLVMPASMVSSFSSNYSPYGINSMMMGEEMFQYTGKLLDSATGFYYEGARCYDPATGRFITQDSVVGSTKDPMSLNRYVYARDNPMKIVDMNGHEWWNPVADISAAVTDVAGAAQDVGNAVSNAWNSLPPDEKIGVIVLVSVVAVAATAGVASGAVAAIDAGTIGSILGTGAAMAGLPVVAMSADDTGALDANELAALSQGSNSVRGQLYRLEGLLGERYTNKQTGEINNGMDAIKARGGLTITFNVPGGKVIPDGVNSAFSPPIVDQVKVGYWADKLDAMKYVDLVDTGQAQPGTFHFYQSPYTGKIGTSDSIWSVLGDRGYDAVYTHGRWWEFPW